MGTLTVYPAIRLEGRLRAQPSKNYTTRFLLAAALSEGESRIEAPAESDDSRALQRCLLELGASIVQDGSALRVRGFGHRPRSGKTLNPGNAGAVLRLLIAISALTEETDFVTDYPHSLGRRPQQDLLDALGQIGVDSQSQGGLLPIRVRGGHRLHPAEIKVQVGQSSQYASGVLFLAPLLPFDSAVKLLGPLKSAAAIRQTIDTLRRFGITLQVSPDLRQIAIPGQQSFQPRSLTVPGDYPGSLALLAAAALRPGQVTVDNLQADDLQGERAALDVLIRMGADLERSGDAVTVRGGRALHGVVEDGDPFTDAVQALCAAAALAEGTTIWHNVATLRLKECDRISDTRAELRKLGVDCDEGEDRLILRGKPAIEGGVCLDSHGDHRMVMMLCALGLAAQRPVVIAEPQHIAKSYPDFFGHLRALGAQLEVSDS
jgi:3-phosphoshikimate 1-carboxyvinyltransferase